MAGSTRDAKLILSVEALGQQNLTNLEKSLRDLAAAGGAGADDFATLADEVGRLGQQNEAIQTFRSLTDEVQKLSEQQATVGERVQQTAQRLQELAQAAQQAKQRQDEARQALIEGQQANVQAGNAIRTLKTEYDSAGKSTQEYRDRLREAVQAQNAAREALVTLREAQRQANVEVSAAEAAQRKAQTAADAAQSSFAKVAKAAADQAAALQQATQAAEAAGVNTQDLAQAEAELVTVFNRGVTAAEEKRAATAEQADADRQAATEARALAELYARGEQALQAEVLAQRDAARSIAEYEAAVRAAAEAERAWQQEANAIVAAKEAERAQLLQTQAAVESLRAAQATAAAEELRQQASLSAAAVDRAIRQRELEATFAPLIQEEQQAAQKARELNDAFATLNVRSVETIQAEIAQVRAAMDALANQGRATGGTLAVAFQQGEARIAELEREIRQVTGTLTTADKAASLFKNSMGQIAAGNLIADGIGYLVNKVKELAAAFVDTIAKQQALSRALNAIYKDSQTASAQMDFLRSTAINAGVAVGGIQSAFVKFSAATNAANIPLKQSNELFAALTKAGGTLGLSSEEVSGALEALSQMASKGTVSLEELRQQLGDRLPGALSLVAKGLGLTDAQLIKLVESGGLAARDLFPALTSALKSMQAEVSGITPAWENFKNILSGVATDAGDAGWATILEGAVKLLGGTVGAVALAFSTLWEGMRITGVAAVALFETLRGNGTEAFAFLNDEIEKTNVRLEKQQLRLEMLINPTQQTAQRLQELSAQQTSVGSTAQIAAAGTERLKDVSVATAEGQAALQAAVNVTAQTYVKAREALDTQIAASEKQAEAAAKNVKAAQDEGAALVALARLRGDDRAELEAAARASELQLAAQEKEAAAKQRVADLLVVEKALLIDTANQRGLTTQQLNDEVQKLDQKIGKAEAEAAQAKGTLSNIQLEVAARQTAVKTYGDQSAALDQLKNAAVATQAAFIEVSRAFAEGRATSDQVRQASIAAAQAQAQYNDALRDSAAKIQSVAQVEQAKINVQLAGLSVSQNAYNMLAQSARASGDYAMAVYYEIEAKRVQIQVTQLQAQAKKLEAEAEIKAVEAERQALEASNNLTDAKKLELEARTLNAKAKAIEAGASADIVRALEQEIVAIRNKQNGLDVMGRSLSNSTDLQRQNTSATESSTSAIDANASALDRQASASERAAAAERKRLKVDENGFSTNSSGQTIVAGGDLTTLTGVYNFAKSAGATEEQAKKIAREFSDSQGNIPYYNNPGMNTYGGTTISDSIRKAVEKYTFGSLGSPVKTTSTATTSTAASTSTPAATNKTVTINIGSTSATIGVASESDANNLVAILRQLETQMGTSS